MSSTQPAPERSNSSTVQRIGVAPSITGSIDLNVVVAFIFGVVFLTVMLVFATQYPNPTGFQIKIFMTALSTAAAGIGGMLPGVIIIRYKGILRAGGALSLFVIVWFTKPVIEQNVVTLHTPTQSAEIVISKFFDDLNKADIQEAYNDFDAAMKDQVSQDSWAQLYTDNIRPLGKFQARRRVSITPATSPPGVPVGVYAQYLYFGKYSNDTKCVPEVVTVRATQNNSWAIFGYQVGSPSIDCPAGLL